MNRALLVLSFVGFCSSFTSANALERLPIGNPMSETTSCAEVEASAIQWLASFVESSGRTPKYGDLLGIPRPLQKTIVPLLPAEEQAALWREHMVTFLQSTSEPARVDAALEAVQMITADLFTDSARSARESHLERVAFIWHVLVAAVGESDAAKMGQLPSWGHWAPGSSAAAVGESDSEVPLCQCNIWWPEDCGSSMSMACLDRNPDCEFRSWGCGFLWLDNCDGVCCLKRGGGYLCP